MSSNRAIRAWTSGETSGGTSVREGAVGFAMEGSFSTVGRRWARGPASPRAAARKKAAISRPAPAALAAIALNSSSVHLTRVWRERRLLSLPAMVLPFALSCAAKGLPGFRGGACPRSVQQRLVQVQEGYSWSRVHGARKPLVRSRRNGLG